MKTKLLFLVAVMFAITLTAQHDDYWTSQATGFAEAQRAITHISIVDQNVVWALGVDGSGGGANVQEFTRTTDGGETWTAGSIGVGDPSSGISMISAVSATTAWCVAFPPTGSETQGIFKTTDGGVSWTRQNTASYNGTGSFCNVVHFWDENNGFAQGDPVDGYYELYTTSDGGEQWTRVPSENIPAPEDGEYGYTSQLYTAGNTLWWTTNHGRIYRSYDLGHTFEVFQTPLTDFGSTASSGEVAFADAVNGYLINAEGLFWTTNNGGESFDLQFPSGDGSTITFGGYVAAIPNTSIVVTTGNSSSSGAGFSFSVDWGQNFITTCDDHGHLDTHFLNRTVGWSGAWSEDATTGGIFKYTGPELVGVKELDAKNFVAYPNPVQDILYLAANEEISNISITNILGQEVYNSDSAALLHSIDLSSLSNGTYLVNVIVGNAQGTVKVIK